MISIILSSVAAGALGAMGLGGGSLLLLYLTMVKGVGQLEAQGINLMFYIPCAALALYFHHKHKLVHWKTGLRLALWGVGGVLGGWYLAGWLQTSIMTKILGGMLLVIGVKELFAGRKKQDP